MYRIGELRDRVKVLRKVKAPDGQGGSVETLNEIAEYWAHVRPASGSETTDFDRVNDTARYLMVFRNGLDITASDVLEWEGEKFNIRFPKKPKNWKLFMEFDVESGVAV